MREKVDGKRHDRVDVLVVGWRVEWALRAAETAIGGVRASSSFSFQQASGVWCSEEMLGGATGSGGC